MPLLPVRSFRIVQNRRDATDVFTLVIEPADGQPMFTFEAGQFVMLHLYNEDGSVWAKAAYSMATAPYESGTSCELSIKVDGDFTQRAEKLIIGDRVGVQGPYGVFVLKTDVDRLVLFAGGIGVTPLRSMIREALHQGKLQEIVLFYSEKTRGNMAFEQELRDLARAHKQFKPVFMLTRECPPDWEGETSRCSRAMVKKYLSDFSNTRYVMCGPDGFMKDIKILLLEEGVDVKTYLQRELF